MSIQGKTPQGSGNATLSDALEYQPERDPEQLLAEAYKGSLGDSLSLDELNRLRAASMQGFDHQAHAEIIKRTEWMSRAGFVSSTIVKYQEPAQRMFIVTRPFDEYGRDDSRLRGQLIEELRETSDGRPPAKPYGGSVRQAMEDKTQIRITRAQARTLFQIDPDGWSEPARMWAVLPRAGAVPTPQPAPDAESAAKPKPLSHSADQEPVNTDNEQAISEVLADAGLNVGQSIDRATIRRLVVPLLNARGYGTEALEAKVKKLHLENKEKLKRVVVVGPDAYEAHSVVAHLLTAKRAARIHVRPRPALVSRA